MKYQLDCGYDIKPRSMSCAARMVANHFGLDDADTRRVIAEDLEVEVCPGEIVLWTGDSGSGKSSLMRTLARQLEGVIWLDELVWCERRLIDLMEGDWKDRVSMLGACGLGEAHLMLRTPGELSDGQRMRFRLALAVSRRPTWLVVDEFTSSLDRVLAKVLAFNLQRVCRMRGIGLLAATTHRDIAEDLQADWEMNCSVDGQVEFVKKKLVFGQSVLPMRSGLATVPNRTGRILLGGIIDVMTWDV